MATEATAVESPGRATTVEAPYRPGWMDSIIGWLERLPGPIWLAYLGVIVAVLGLIALEGFASRVGISGTSGAYFVYTFFFVFPLAAYHYLAAGARSAWDAFRPATGLDYITSAQMRLELSTTPFRPVAVIWIGVALLNTLVSFVVPESTDLANQPPAYFALRVVSESLWVAPTSIVLVYLVVRQLRLVASLHRSVERVDLLRPAPLHAMSRLTARSAIALIALAVASGLPLPGVSEAAWVATAIFFSLPFVVLAVVVFAVPLRGMSQLLAREKARQLGAISERYEAASTRLHRLVDEETADGREAEALRLANVRVDTLNKAIATLLQERDFIRRQSTWPWDASTLRAVVSAVALPIALFILTRLLDQLIF